MRRYQLAIAPRIHDHEHETDRPRVLLLKCGAFDPGRSVSVLEVEESALDLLVDDLVGPEEDEVGGPSVWIADWKLESWAERIMRLRDEVFGDAELTAVSQRRLARRKGLDTDSQANRGRYRTERIEMDARVTIGYAHYRGRRKHRPSGGLLDRHGE